MSWLIRVIRWSFHLLVVVIPLIFLPNTSELFEFNKMIVVYLLTTVITSAWIAEMLIQKKVIFTRTSLDWPILIFLASQILSLIFSIDQRTSWLGYYSRFNGGFVSLVCYSLLYWAFVTFMDAKSSMSTVKCALSTAAIVSIYGVLQHFGIDDQIWVQDVKTRVFSTLGQPNWLAAFLVALIFIPISLAIKSQNRTLRTSYLALSTTMFITLLFTKSRSGLLAFGISSVIYWGLSFRDLGKLDFRSIRNLVIYVLLTLTLTLTIPNPIRDLILRTEHLALSTVSTGPALETGGTESGVIRKIVWTGAIRIWKFTPKNFWIGTGPETFAMAYYQHRPIEHNQTSEWELLYNKAHNEFLNYLSTTGFLGLGSYLLLLGAMLFVLIKKMSPENWALRTAILAGGVSIPITNFWGFSVVTSNLLLFLLPALAVSFNTDPRQFDHLTVKQITRPQQFGFLICIFTFCYLIFNIFKYWLADTQYAAGQKDLKTFTATEDPSYIASSYANYLSAYNLNPNDPPILSDLATVMAYVSILTSDSDATASSDLAQTAMALSQRAIDTSPFHPNHYKTRSRTAIILSTVDPTYLDVAKSALLTAQKISPTDPRIPYNLAAVAKYQNQTATASAYLKQSLDLKPDFADAVEMASEN